MALRKYNERNKGKYIGDSSSSKRLKQNIAYILLNR